MATRRRTTSRRTTSRRTTGRRPAAAASRRKSTTRARRSGSSSSSRDQALQFRLKKEQARRAKSGSKYPSLNPFQKLLRGLK